MATIPPSPNSVLEAARTSLWLRAALNSLAPGGAWRGMAPDGVATPFIVYTPYPGGLGDVGRVGAYRLWNESDWLVKVVGPASGDAALVAVADAVDARLQRAMGEAAGADCTILLCLRQNSDMLDEPEPINSEVYLNARSFWRIRTQRNGS